MLVATINQPGHPEVRGHQRNEIQSAARTHQISSFFQEFTAGMRLGHLKFFDEAERAFYRAFGSTDCPEWKNAAQHMIRYFALVRGDYVLADALLAAVARESKE